MVLQDVWCGCSEGLRAVIQSDASPRLWSNGMADVKQPAREQAELMREDRSNADDRMLRGERATTEAGAEFELGFGVGPERRPIRKRARR